MLLDQQSFRVSESTGIDLGETNDSARHADQANVMEPGAKLKDLPLLRRHLQTIGNGFAQLENPSGLRSQARIERLHRFQAEFNGLVQIPVQRIIQSDKLS